ncbi:TonB-dependent receptor [Sphingopyxis sp. DHUNG17]|uniref:TonB-dependent receptor n=1 Tax=Sphingopyxis jiangsuensis TaxID=2871171 RepID=UPI00191D3580|nr:TonB-dependent receptor [Sphingopyxis lutea]MBL0769208.1 TonB-dependent receptor [Sphingopyxis lutea]
MHQLRSIRSRILLGTCLSLAAALPGAAIASDLVGTVSDATDTRALQSAQVRLVELGRTAEADRDGSFRFSDVPAGTYTLEARYVGAAPVTRTVEVPASGTVTANLVLGTDGSILVIGQAANLSSSLSRQRAADGVESVLTRDGIGQFPDQNVAESLRRLPGVNILDDQGEGRFVSIRGLDPELNAASVNGVRLPAPESDVRSVALDVISSDIIESIEVKKSLTPDMDADTIGASIEIRTTSAFDRKKDLLVVKAEGSYNDLTESVSPKGSFDFSKKLGDNVGVAGGISYYKRKFATNNQEVDGWDEDDGLVYADTVEYRDYDVERERISASLSLDFRVGDTTTLYARGLYSQFDDQEYRRRLTFEMDEAPSAGDANGVSFDADDGEISVQRDLKDRFERQRIRSLVFGGETDSGPWNLKYSASWAKSSEKEAGSIDPVVYERVFEDGDGFGVDFDYRRDKIVPYAITSGAAAFLDPSEYELDKVELTTLSDARDREYALKADIARSFAMQDGAFTLQFGTKARWRKKSYNADLEIYEWDGADDLTLDMHDLLGPQDYDLAAIEPMLAKKKFRPFFFQNIGSFELDDGDTFEESEVADFMVKEDVLAGYALGRWDSDMLRIIGGVRVEQTKNDIRGKEVILDDETVTPLRFTRKYTDWLPSLTFRFEPQQNLVLRAAGYRSLVRPKLSKLAPNVIIDDDEGEAGNPFLKPYRAWNADLSAEYYFGRNAAVSAGFFWKDIKDYIVDVTEFDTSYNGIDLDELTTAINGESAEIKGFEFSYSQQMSFLPAPFDGLLAQFNYTYTDAKGTLVSYDDDDQPYLRTIGLPASSKHTFNAVLGYEKGPVSLRVAGTYRDKYLDEAGGAANEDRIVADQFKLDLSAKFRITPGVRIFAEWVNVTDAPYFAYQQFEGRRRLLQYEDYSWTAKFGVSANF